MEGFLFISRRPPVRGFIRTLFKLVAGADSGALHLQRVGGFVFIIASRGIVTRFGEEPVGGIRDSIVDGSTLSLGMGAGNNLDVGNAGQILLKEGRKRWGTSHVTRRIVVVAVHDKQLFVDAIPSLPGPGGFVSTTSVRK
ncbi:hypothetical protein E4U12_001051, partial [Claviceps purpurea]